MGRPLGGTVQGHGFGSAPLSAGSEWTAHQLSGLTGIGAFAAYFSALQRRWPIPSTREALKIGTSWLLLTVAFEFSFGRLVAKQSWEELGADYNPREGRTWPLVLAWIAVGPAVVRRMAP
jgi:hypothetical protein